jgi:MoxR-like ATPase
MSQKLEVLKKVLNRTRREVARVIIGQDPVVDMALVAIFSGQHALIEGVPGVAKTLMVRTLAHALGCEFARIQFTPDLMPADITGTNVFNLKENAFALVKGPVFTTFLLADEINRAPAKTQSALLQAMQERAVTIDRQTHRLNPNFTVFATQNPVEYQGTYPLPEAQKDRFMLKINMEPPDRDQEVDLARRMLGTSAPEAILESGEVKPVLGAEVLTKVKSYLPEVLVSEELTAYIVDIVRRSRRHPSVMVGAGPRASQALLLASRTLAAIRERDFVTPDDIKAMAPTVMGHRLILQPEFEVEGLSIDEVIQEILQALPVPR